jgi:lysophospholipase L1-like esterase
MASVVINGTEFDKAFNNGLVPQNFKYRFLTEGDSWMDRSSATRPSLLQSLAPAMDAGGDDVLIINLSRFGDTMRRIGECLSPEFAQWITTQFDWNFDAILFSAGGNDFIDAARDPAPGQGILLDLAVQPTPPSGHDCVSRNAVGDLVTRWLDPNFSALYEFVQNSRHADVPIFLNSYDTPTARNAPATPGGRTWLREAYLKNSIPQSHWEDLTGSIFNDIEAAIRQWSVDRPSVHVVPTVNTLTAALVSSTGSDADWLNEIHPNASGWRKLAGVWRASIKNVLI